MLAMIALFCLAAQSAQVSVETFAQDLVQRYPAPGLAVISVDENGAIDVVYAGTRQLGGDEEVGFGDLWHIGSNAKAMTATLAMALVEDGLISLETTVSEQLGDNTNVHEAWSDVTLADLLSHRGGVAPNAGRLTAVRYMLFPGRGDNGPSKDRQNVLRGVLKKPPTGEVGTFVYSNLGFTLAGAMLGDAAGETYENALHKFLFGPLGMDGVLLGAPGGTPGSFNRGHSGEPLEMAPAGADNPAFMSPAGTWSFTAESYARFLADQLLGLRGEEALLSTESYAAMAADRGDDDEDYGLGWGLTREGWLSHSGSNTFWYVVALVAPDRGRAVAILTNAEPIGGVGQDLRALMEQLDSDDAVLTEE